MINTPISIVAIGSVSALGSSAKDIWESYLNDQHLLSRQNINGNQSWVSPLKTGLKEEIYALKQSHPYYGELDDSVLFAVAAARRALSGSGWSRKEVFGINIGSSRGATTLFERYYQDYLTKSEVPTLSSPTTTLGNISSWVAHDLGSTGPELSHSITCSSALHAMLNGIAWIRSGMAGKFLVGGSEAPLTPFTIAQMKALKIYSRLKEEYPCRALDLEKKHNSMVLGEGACIAAIEAGIPENALAYIEGVGYATEPLEHPVSISAEAVCFQQSMQMALETISPDDVDVIVMHAPGTIKGDFSEKKAIEKIFCNKKPFLTTNKWKVGHTFGASGMLSVEMAILMLQQQRFIQVPFIDYQAIPKKLNKIMVNAVGFGGNAVSVLLSRPDA